MSDYTATATRAAATLARKGAPVTFTSPNAGRTYDPDTGLWTDGTGPQSFSGSAVQDVNDPEQFAALGLTLRDPVTLLVSKMSEGTPAPGMTFAWAGRTYSVKSVEHVAPNGTPIISTVIGDR